MTTSFQPGGQQSGGPYYGTTVEPQQYYPTAGHPAAPVPQVDRHHPYPGYQPDQTAWSQSMPQSMFQPAPQPYQSMFQPYRPPTWTTPAPGANRNKVVAAFIAVAVLLVAGAVTLIVVVNNGDSAAPGPQAPPSAPVVSAPTSAGPVQPQPFPSGTAAPSPAGPPVPAQPTPAQPTPAQSVPAQPTPAQPTPAQPTPAQPTPEQTVPAPPAGAPGQREAEQAAAGFVAALRSADFAGAATYVCSTQAAAFAAGAAQLSGKVQLQTMQVADVAVDGSSAVMTMTYRAAGQAETLHESLPMTVESGAWKICN